MNPTSELYSAIQAAFDHFNRISENLGACPELDSV